MILLAMSYQWPDYDQQYEGWNPQMMMHSGDHTVQPPSNIMPHQFTPQQSNYMYVTSAQQATNTPPPPPPPPITAQAHNIPQPQQHYTYGPARTQAQQHKTSPFTQTTAYTSQTKVPTNTAQQTATKANTHTAPTTPQVQPAAQPQTSTPTPTQTTPTLSPNPAHVVLTQVAVSDKWTATADCYDSNTNLGVQSTE